MLPLRRESLRAALVLLAAVCACAAWLAWKTLGDPQTPFLASHAGAAWILYPTPPSPRSQLGVEIDATFRRTFNLRRLPERALLTARCFRRGSISLNGTAVAATSPAASWKKAVHVNVSGLLRPGPNRIEVRVNNDFGPPALWLSLTAKDLQLATDESWDASLGGASPRKARRAAVPLTGWSSSGSARTSAATNPSPALALRANLPLLLFFAAVSLLALVMAEAWRRRRGRTGGLTRGEAVALFALAAVAWSALFWNNRRLFALWGFDVPAHLDYVRAVLEQGRLPLANEGWEMHQPPLYYLLAAGLLRLAGHARLEDGAVELLRGLGWAAGLLQLGAVLAGLRLVFPGRARPVVAGACVAAFLPVQLYIFQYVSNEGLHAALASAALFLTLRILARDDLSAVSHLSLGAVLGLAMLTKLTALLLVIVVTAVLAGRLLVRGTRSPGIWARTAGSTLLACIAVCGWHYARVAARFGSPFAGAWDPASGFPWWQNPGYRMAGDFLRFGRALTEPLFSAMHSVPDALYSTLWGDGLLGGSSLLTLRPPWSWGLMAAGYLLALLPTAAILLGLAAATIRLVRDPRAEWFLLLGVLGATGFAWLALCLRLPFYGQAKAFFGLAALLPLSAAAGCGCDLLARPGRLARALVFTLLGTWALAAWATFWIPGGGTGEPSPEAIATIDPRGLLARANEARERGQVSGAVSLSRQATDLEPDHEQAWLELGALLARAGDTRGAIAALQEAVRVTPRDPTAHRWLGRLFALHGEAARARYHAELAQRIERTAARYPAAP